MSKKELPSFDNLLNSNWDYVYNYLFKKTSNDYVSEEITIKSFSKAFEKIDTYDSKYNFKTWLISIAKNNYSDYLKKKKLPKVKLLITYLQKILKKEKRLQFHLVMV